MALPVLLGATLPSVDDCSRSAPPTPYSGVAGMPRNGWLASVGITGWDQSECPAGMRRNTQVIGLVYVFAVVWWLGKREERRLGLTAAASGALPVGAAVTAGPVMKELTPEQQLLRRPHLFWPNLLLTLVVMGVMIGGWVDPVVMFMLGTVIALILNYPKPAEQRARIDAHAKAALLMAAILLAAGAFTGIMTGTGMLKALAQAAIAVVPAS